MVTPGGGLRRLAGSTLPAAADDYAALALGCRDFARAAKDSDAAALAALFLGQLDARFYDPAGCVYLGGPKPPGPGLFMRPPAPDDPPSAGPLALLGGAPHSAAVAAALSSSLDETSAQAPGDQLLALASYASQESAK